MIIDIHPMTVTRAVALGYVLAEVVLIGAMFIKMVQMFINLGGL